MFNLPGCKRKCPNLLVTFNVDGYEGTTDVVYSQCHWCEEICRSEHFGVWGRGGYHFKYVPKGNIFWELFLVHLGLEGKLFMLHVVTEKSEQKTISDLSAITRCSMLFQDNIMKQLSYYTNVSQSCLPGN